MIQKLNFQQNNKKLFSFIVLITLAVFPLYAARNTNSCEYKTFSIKTNDKVSNLDLLSKVANSCNFSIVIKDDFARKTLKDSLDGVNVENLTLNELFKLLIGENDLYYKYSQNFLVISSLKTKIFNLDYITSIRNGTSVLNASVDATPQENGGARTVNSDNSIKSSDSFDFWAKISNEISSVLNTKRDKYKADVPIINPNAGIITVTATKKQLDRVERYIDILRKRLHKQVLINVSIISVGLNHSSSKGIDWSKFNLSLNGKLSLNSNNGTGSNSLNHLHISNSYTVLSNNVFSMTGLIDFLSKQGNTKIVSSPKVLALNNQQALITIGDNINYQVNDVTTNGTTGGTQSAPKNYSIFIGILLNITPEISNNNEVTLRINPSVSNFKYPQDNVQQNTTNPRQIAPDTSEKKLSTVVRVKNGSTIILGGLITNSKEKTHSSVPILSDIPLIGNAFKHTGDTIRSQELIFVITPTVIGERGITKTSLRDLGFSKRIYEQ